MHDVNCNSFHIDRVPYRVVLIFKFAILYLLPCRMVHFVKKLRKNYSPLGWKEVVPQEDWKSVRAKISLILRYKLALHRNKWYFRHYKIGGRTWVSLDPPLRWLKNHYYLFGELKNDLFIITSRCNWKINYLLRKDFPCSKPFSRRQFKNFNFALIYNTRVEAPPTF